MNPPQNTEYARGSEYIMYYLFIRKIEFTSYHASLNQKYLHGPLFVYFVGVSDKGHELRETIFKHKIVNIFLPVSFNICFGCSKEPSH